MPPEFNDSCRNTFIRIFVTLSIFLQKFLWETPFYHPSKFSHLERICVLNLDGQGYIYIHIYIYIYIYPCYVGSRILILYCEKFKMQSLKPELVPLLILSIRSFSTGSNWLYNTFSWLYICTSVFCVKLKLRHLWSMSLKVWLYLPKLPVHKISRKTGQWSCFYG